MQKAITSRKDKYKFFVYTEFYTKLYTEAVVEQILCLCGAVPSVRCFAFISDFFNQAVLYIVLLFSLGYSLSKTCCIFMSVQQLNVPVLHFFAPCSPQGLQAGWGSA